VNDAGLRARVVALAGTPAARALAVGLVLGAAIAAVLVALFADRPRSSAHVIDDPVTIKRALSATTALFGDPLEAEIDVYSNDGSVAAGSVRVSTDFRPYRIATTSVNRESQGGVSLLRTRISLECLARGCLPPKGGARVIRFPPSAVTYREGGRDVRVPVSFEPLQLSSRLPRDTTARVGIIDTAPPLDPRLGRSPETLRTLFLLAAAVLGLAGAALVVAGLWPSSFLAKRRRRSLSPLERSLQRVEAAARGDDEPARRRTLDDLATRLGDVPSLALELQARALAWGQRPPEPEALTLLALQVRTTLNGRSQG
jgi:hypothetical protein